jgi:UDP-N-acetylglucosamine 2-epimerase (non-hydrolysing)
MIDTLVAMRERFEAIDSPGQHGLERGSYVIVTLHRPALVDHHDSLRAVIDGLDQIAREYDVVFPVHPRTRSNLAKAGIEPSGDVRLIDPVGYLEFIGLVRHAAAVLTDSGGIQEETTYLGVPCFTLRDNTERPVTVELGTNTLLGKQPSRIAELPALIADSADRAARVPPGWDGRAAERIVDVISQLPR